MRTYLLLLFFVINTEIFAADHLGWSVLGTVDGSIYGGNSDQSWLSGGIGKHRVGQDDDKFMLQSAISIKYDFNLQSRFMIEGAYYSDPENKLGVTQAFWQFKPISTEHWRSNYKMGAFHAPISLENPGALWHSLYTITPSVINTWVGEEMRTIGLQGRWSWKPSLTSSHRITPLAAIFQGNDTSGAMLAWRGWTAHNRYSLLGEKFPIAPLPVIQPNAPFQRQVPEYEPYMELDNKVGYYYGLNWDYARKVSLRYFYYDNRADPLVLKHGQWAWKTRFHHFGLKANLKNQWILISQLIDGNLVLGPGAIDNDFRSQFILISKKLNQHRYSVRLEFFKVIDRDFFLTIDPNNESGKRATVSYTRQINTSIYTSLELAQLRSDRSYRSLLGQLNKQVDNQVTLQVRYRF